MSIRRVDLLTSSAALACASALGGSRAAAADLTHVRVSTTMTDDTTVLYYALQTGMFKKAGLDVEYIVSKSGSAAAEAVVTGAIDIGKSSLVNLLNAHVRGIPIELITAGAVYGSKLSPASSILVGLDSNINAAKDLNGKTIAVAYLQDFHSLLARIWVDQGGGDSKTVKFLEIPDSAQGASVIAHRVDACLLQEPALSIALKTKQLRAFPLTSMNLGAFLYSAWFAKTDWAAKHSDIVDAFTRVMSASSAYTNAHQDQTAKMMAQATGVTVDSVLAMQRLRSATTLDAANVQPMIDASARYGLLPQAFPASDMIYVSPARR